MATCLFSTQSTGQANLLELVTVEPDGIVSKPLMETRGAKVLLFALDAGQELSEHTSAYAASVHVLDGRVQLLVNGKEHALGVNDFLVMPAQAPHSVIAESATRMLLTLFIE